MDTSRLYLDGKWVETKDVFPVMDPGTGEKIAEVPAAGKSETAAAISAAQRAFPDWRARRYVAIIP